VRERERERERERIHTHKEGGGGGRESGVVTEVEWCWRCIYILKKNEKKLI
jgi:hypothetical protein